MKRKNESARTNIRQRVYAVIKDVTTPEGARGVCIVGVHDSRKKAGKCKERSEMISEIKRSVENFMHDARRVGSEVVTKHHIQSFTLNDDLLNIAEGMV